MHNTNPYFTYFFQEYCHAQGAKLVEPDSYDKMGHLEGIYDGILGTLLRFTRC